MDSNVFIENVKARCKELGTTPTVACTESGAGKNLITNMKKGISPSLERVGLLAEYLHCSISDLTGELSPSDVDLQLEEFFDRFRRLTPEERKRTIRKVEIAFFDEDQDGEK